MRKWTLRIPCFALALTLLLSGIAFAAPDEPAFSDISGHWARDVIQRGAQDGLVLGFEDGTFRPNDPITAAQVVTVFCRVLNAQTQAAPAGLDGSEWYYTDAAKAVALGIIPDGAGLGGPVVRKDAAVLTARAFQYTAAEADTGVLLPYSDGASLTGEYRTDMALLVQAGVFVGYGGSLAVDSSLTRAEFLTLFYRIVQNILPASQAQSVLSGGTMLSGPGELSGEVFTSGLWLDCTAAPVTLTDVTAPLVVLRPQVPGGLTLDGATQIGRLVYAGFAGAEAAFTADGTSSVNTLVVGQAGDSVRVVQGVRRVEITGAGQRVTVDGQVDEIVISGQNARLTLNGTADKLIVAGQNSAVTGAGYAANVEKRTQLCSVDVAAGTTTENYDSGISGVTVTLSAPNVLPAGETLRVTAAIDSPVSDKLCDFIWSVDGVSVGENAIVLQQGEQSIDLTYNYAYSKDMPLSSSVGLELRYVTQDGQDQRVSAAANVTLENYSEDYYYQRDVDRVLGLVTTGYKGNWTLDWALNNDYQSYEKEIWINAKGYSSATQYLCWVSTAYQRVNVFEGGAGNWTLTKTFLCGTGATQTQTPVGVYTVFGRSTAGWVTSTYCVRPVVNFKMGSGYAFHSRLYDPKHTHLIDASIGFPVSHGCVRMYDEDIQWIYNYIPNNTTVVVY